MDEKELENFLKIHATPQKERERVISSRRYNLIVWRRGNDNEKEPIYRHEYLTMRQARALKKDYLREDNLFCDIEEDVTIDRNGNEITFTEKPEHPIVCGPTKFNTPEATKRIIERDRRKNRAKASFRNRLPKAKSGKTIRYINSFTDPKSPLYPMYLDNVKRRGFTVIVKPLGQKFIGLQNEVAEFIFSLLKTGAYTKNDLDISFNGR